MSILSTTSPSTPCLAATTTIKPLKHPCLPLLELCRHSTEFTQVHATLVKLGLIQHPVFSTRLTALYAASTSTADYAHHLFDRDPNPNAFVYNAMIRSHVQNHQPELALALFLQMVGNGVEPNSLTFPFVLKACSIIKAVEEGKQLHGLVLKLGLDVDLYVRNSLIQVYCTVGLLSVALQLFDRMSQRDVVSWNTMISGLLEAGLLKNARELFDQMPERSVVSWNCLIDGYVKCGLLEAARELFNLTTAKNSVTWNTMIGGYCRSGMMEEAYSLFNQMPVEVKDLSSFVAMIDGYSRGGSYDKVLEIFNDMIVRKIESNSFIIVSVLSACSHLAALEQGQWVHEYLSRHRLRLDAVLGTALLDMYAKCGRIDEALVVFNGMENRDIGAWNSMIANVGVHGYGKDALRFFFKMLDSGMVPDEITFLSILSACRHSGLVDEGQKCFNLMTKVYDITPKDEHYGCIVDLLCRSRLLNEAKGFIEANNAKFSVPTWGSLLEASSRLGNIEMSEYAAKHLLELDPRDTRCYVALSNMYSRAGRWNDAVEIRKQMRNAGMEKIPGCSSIEVDGVVKEFRIGSGINTC